MYSESEDGGYCKYCMLFARYEPLVQELGVLVNRPLTNFKKATEKLNEHFCSKGRRPHQGAVERVMTFMVAMKKGAVSIDQQLSSKKAKLVAENRMKMRSIAATVIFCGQQGIALRGRHDDRLDDASESINHGNFNALFQFRIDAGDEAVKEHLKTAGRNALYTS